MLYGYPVAGPCDYTGFIGRVRFPEVQSLQAIAGIVLPALGAGDA